MDNEPKQEKDDIGEELIRKIILWILVFFISIMLFLMAIIQPRFFTFLN